MSCTVGDFASHLGSIFKGELIALVHVTELSIYYIIYNVGLLMTVFTFFLSLRPLPGSTSQKR